MDQFRIRGERPLQGKVNVSGSKNAALPILISSLLTEKTCAFERVPNLEDIRMTFKLLRHLGAKVESDLSASGRVRIQAGEIPEKAAPYDLVRKMRASVLVLGPLVARFGKARVSLPGGCAIGTRPINYHLAGLERLGVKIQLENGYILAEAGRLKGNRIALEFPSVGATENLMMAASLAEGETLIENAAREPEIVDLAEVLRKMGAEISGEGTEKIRIFGRDTLQGCDHQVMGDRIEAGTFLAAAVATQGSIRVEGIQSVWLEAVLNQLTEAGAEIRSDESAIELKMSDAPNPIRVQTQPYPGFPTDMQAQLMSALLMAKGMSVLTENVFENRFMHVPELNRLGARIEVQGHRAMVTGVDQLIGAPLMATDLRASASLVIGGLVAKGETIVNRIYHLDRGYDSMEKKLTKLGADVERVVNR